MARTTKANRADKSNDIDNTINQISEAEAYNVLEFAQNMWQGVYTPYLVNSRMQDVNVNPLKATEDGITSALLDPKNSELELIGYSEYFELTDMLYKRQIQYLGNLLSWDYTYECSNAIDTDYTSPAYKKDEKIFEDFLNKFNVKREFTQIVRQLMRRETFYGIFREDGDQYTFQELPQKYCKITGRFEYGLLYDLDYMWFLANPGVDINCYPKVIKTTFRNLFKDKNNNLYVPSGNYDKRDDSWVYWNQCSPNEGFWCFKFNPEIASEVPFFAPMFSDLVLRPLVRNLQKNSYIIEASKVLMGLIGFNKDNKSGNVKDSLNLSPETAGKFARLVREGLTKEIQFAIAPFESVEKFEFNGTDKNILDQYNKVTVASSGSNARLLYMTDKSNAEESKSSLAIDEQVMTYIYPFFEDFINYQINRKTKKFKFKIYFEGTQMPNNRQARLDKSMLLAQSGIVLPQSIAAAIGKSPFTFEKQLAMAKAKGFVDGLTPILMSSQMSGAEDGSSDKKNGRPKKSDDKISEAGSTTRDAGSNIEKGGKI